jgi:hypothetical protein
MRALLRRRRGCRAAALLPGLGPGAACGRAVHRALAPAHLPPRRGPVGHGLGLGRAAVAKRRVQGLARLGLFPR